MGLVIEGVYFFYRKMRILSDVNLKIESGELTCLIGPNGAGKSTLLKVIAGLLRPQRGIVRFEGKVKERDIGYLPQSPSFTPHLTVFEAVLTGRIQHFNFSPNENDLKSVEKTLKLLKITELAWRRLGELSGGQRQKVFLAITLVKEPSIVLLDEPTTNLDLKSQLEVMELIKRLVAEKRILAIVTTHELNSSLKFADKVAIMDSGKILAFGKPEDVLEKELLKSLYKVEIEVVKCNGTISIIPVKLIDDA
ncbi:MAG: ABC transporter ATP-binding protein [Archaeoglobaceae archaeon]